MELAQQCTRCGRDVHPARTTWLELNALTLKYYAEPGNVPQNESQGWFPFGPDCAQKEACDA